MKQVVPRDVPAIRQHVLECSSIAIVRTQFQGLVHHVMQLVVLENVIIASGEEHAVRNIMEQVVGRPTPNALEFDAP